MFGASVGKLVAGDENNFLPVACRYRRAGRAIFLVAVGFEGIVVVLSYWLDFGKSNKHLKIFIAVCERLISRFDLMHKPEFVG